MNNRILLSLLLCITCTITKTMDNDTETLIAKITEDLAGRIPKAQLEKRTKELIAERAEAQKEQTRFAERTETLTVKRTEAFTAERAKALIKKRKAYNRLYAAMTITMMGIDLANSYLWIKDEKIPAQKILQREGFFNVFKDPNEYTPCECPTGERSCQVQLRPNTYTYNCMPAISDQLFDGLYNVSGQVSHGITAWRLCSGGVNLYKLYQVEQILNTQLTTENKEINRATNDEEIEITAENKKIKPSIWVKVQASSGLIETLLSTTTIITSACKHFPYTFTLWWLNGIVDSVGAFNSYENEKACEKLRLKREERERLLNEAIFYK